MNFESRRQLLVRGLRKVFWRACAAILLLSLPTFSYLVPRVSSPSADTTVGRNVDRSRFVREDSSSGFVSGTSQFVGSSAPFGSGTRSFASSSPPRHRTRSIVRPRSHPNASNRDRPRREGRGALSTNPAQNGSRPEGDLDHQGESGVQRVEPAVAAELSRMEADYRSAMTNLFPSTRYSQTGIIGNVFQDALNNQNGSGGDSTSDGNNGNGNQDNGGNSGDSGDSGNNGNGGDNGSGGNPPPPPPPPPPPASSVEEGFLVLSPPQAGHPLEILHRATRDPDGYFLLDDGSRIEALSGLVGFPQDMLVVPEGGILVTQSSTAPQVLKIILIQGVSQGTSVSGYLDDRGQQQFWFNGTMLFERVLSSALYDVNDDGEEELVCTFASNPNLVVYQIAGNEINYLRELTLPFKPAALVTTERTAPIDVRYLQVFDSTLKRSVTFSSQFPGVYSFSTPPTYEGKVSLDTTPGSIPAAGFTAFIYRDRVVLFQTQDTESALMASLSTSSGFPRLVVGDYSGDETRQMVFLP